MDLGTRILIICLAALLASGLVPMPAPAPAQAEPVAPPETEAPAPPPTVGVTEMEDVSSTDWFYTYVRLGFRHGFLHGTDGRFEPNRVLTRAEFITILGRLHQALGGLLGRADDSLFELYTDITAEAFYLPYLFWSTAQGLVEADEYDRFRPGDSIRREEMALILARYLDVFRLHPHFEDIAQERPSYADWEDIAPWAYHEAHLLQNYGLMHGIHVPGGTPGVYLFRPDGSTLRGEAAAIFARLFNQVFEAPAAV